MHTELFTEPFDLERFKQGEPAWISGRPRPLVARFVKLDSPSMLAYTKEGGGTYYEFNSYAEEFWKMKPQAQADGWIPHDGGDCPIPWARDGECETKFRSGKTYKYLGLGNSYWKRAGTPSDIVSWRLTDGWIPVLGGGMPQEIAHCKGREWEFRTQDGRILEAICPAIRLSFIGIVAVRPIKQPAGNLAIPEPLNTEECLSVPARSSVAYNRFRNSPRGKQALAQIGIHEGKPVAPLGQCEIERLIMESLEEAFK